MLSDRALGWLRSLDRATRTAPGPDMPAFEVALAMGLMARQVPAWTEPFIAVLDRLINRRSPSVADAGTLEADADLLVLVAIRSLIGGDDRWDRPSQLTADGGRSSTWTSETLAERLAARWRAAPPDVHRSPLGPARAGLALLLHDRAHGGDRHARVLTAWWDRARGPLEARIAQAGEEGTAADLLTVALCLVPQASAEEIRPLVEAAGPSLLASFARREPPATVGLARQLATFLVLTRELGQDDLAEQARSAAGAAAFAPSWNEARGELAWWPTDAAGDAPPSSSALLAANALAAAAEVAGPGCWAALAAGCLPACPQVVDVAFPAVAASRAEWLNDCLLMWLRPLLEDRRAYTSFRLEGAVPRVWWISGVDNATADVSSHSVVVRLPRVRCDLEFTPSSY